MVRASPATGASPRHFDQNDALTTATRGPPTCNSSDRNPRPFDGVTPITSKNAFEINVMRTSCGSLAPDTGVGPYGAISAIALKLWVPSRQSLKFGSDTLPLLPDVKIWYRRTIRSDCGYGKGLISTPPTTLNIAAAAPTPRPKVRITVAVNAGTRTSVRRPIRMSRRKSRTMAPRNSSRVVSRVCSTPPNFTSAARRAPRGSMPSRMFLAVCCSM